MKSDEETEINGMGPDIQPEDIQELFNQLDDLTEKIFSSFQEAFQVLYQIQCMNKSWSVFRKRK